MHNNLFATVLSEIRSRATAEDEIFACAIIICARNIIYNYYNNMCLSNYRIRSPRWYTIISSPRCEVSRPLRTSFAREMTDISTCRHAHSSSHSRRPGIGRPFLYCAFPYNIILCESPYSIIIILYYNAIIMGTYE